MATDKSKWSIPYPSDEDINKQVALIVKQGLPKKQNLILSIAEIRRQMGWQYLFINRGEALFSGCLMIIVLAYLFLVSNEAANQAPDFYGMLFILSPLSFLSFMAYGYYHKKVNDTFELEMTMKYTVYQLLVVRMLVFSSMAIFVNITVVFILSYKVDLNVLRGILVSMTGLFVFSAGLLFVLRSGHFLKRSVLFIAAWVLVNTVLFLLSGKEYGAVLNTLPMISYGVILLVSFWIYLISLKHVFNRRHEEALAC
ncbi:hypothetical protein [Metabacillus sp. SLBN-84]